MNARELLAAVPQTWKHPVYNEDGEYDGVSVGYFGADKQAARMLQTLRAAAGSDRVVLVFDGDDVTIHTLAEAADEECWDAAHRDVPPLYHLRPVGVPQEPHQ